MTDGFDKDLLMLGGTLAGFTVFFCVVYGFLLVVHLIRVAILQNLSVARADD